MDELYDAAKKSEEHYQVQELSVIDPEDMVQPIPRTRRWIERRWSERRKASREHFRRLFTSIRSWKVSSRSGAKV